MPCFESTREGTTVHLTLTDKLTIEHARDLHSELVDLVREHERIVLHTEGIEKVDLTFLQLLFSLSISLDKARKTLSFSGKSMAPPLRDAAEGAGFFRYVRRDEHQPNMQLLHDLVYSGDEL